jgi:hypothetical protein
MFSPFGKAEWDSRSGGTRLAAAGHDPIGHCSAPPQPSLLKYFKVFIKA